MGYAELILTRKDKICIINFVLLFFRRLLSGENPNETMQIVGRGNPVNIVNSYHQNKHSKTAGSVKKTEPAKPTKEEAYGGE